MEKLEWHVIPTLPSSDVEIKKIKVAGKAICLVRTKGKWLAVGSRCPHAGADLSQGWCEGNKIVCPFHRHKFDLQTGKGDVGQGNFINTYPLKEENGHLYVAIRKPWWKTLFSE